MTKRFSRAPLTGIVVANKIDLAPNVPKDALGVSALTGEGIETLRDAILAAVAPKIEQEAGFITSVRHEALLREALQALRSGS